MIKSCERALPILWRVWHSNKFYRTKASPGLPILVKLGTEYRKNAIISSHCLKFPCRARRRRGEGGGGENYMSAGAFGYNKLLKFRTQEAYLVGDFSAAIIHLPPSPLHPLRCNIQTISLFSDSPRQLIGYSRFSCRPSLFLSLTLLLHIRRRARSSFHLKLATSFHDFSRLPNENIVDHAVVPHCITIFV